MLNLFEIKKIKNVEKVIIPNPPIWIRDMITIWPKRVSFALISMTVRPVTQVADVAENNASMKESGLPAAAYGNFNSAVPNKMIVAKLNRSNCVGLSFPIASITTHQNTYRTQRREIGGNNFDSCRDGNSQNHAYNSPQKTPENQKQDDY